jgi:hypothetical protein
LQTRAELQKGDDMIRGGDHLLTEAIHANPDYALRYGWSEMWRDLQEIREEAERLRREHEHHG